MGPDNAGLTNIKPVCEQNHCRNEHLLTEWSLVEADEGNREERWGIFAPG